MTLLGFLCAWANTPFGVALGIALVFAALSWSGALSLFAGGGDDADGDHEADADGDHEADADHDSDDADDGDGDDEADDDEGDERGVLAHVLAPLGVGKVPLSVLWQSFAVVFGVTGYAANARYIARGAVPLVSLAWTIPIAFVVAYAVVALLARILAPLFSTEASEASSRSDLLGQVGVVISSQVSETFGEVRFREKNGHDVRVICALDEGLRPAREGEKVVVVGVDVDTKKILVAPLDAYDEPPPATKPSSDDDTSDEAVAARKSA